MDGCKRGARISRFGSRTLSWEDGSWETEVGVVDRTEAPQFAYALMPKETGSTEELIE